MEERFDSIDPSRRSSIMKDMEFALDFAPSPPPLHLPSLDSAKELPTIKTNEILVEKLLSSLREIDKVVETKVQIIESLDITIQIVSYKIYEATHEFKVKIGEMKDERNRLLVSIENRSELSLILHDLDQKILELEKELDSKIKSYNQEKIELQQQAELIIFQLDEDIAIMHARLKDLKDELEVKKGTMYRVQMVIINEKYAPILEELEKHLLNYEKLQLTGWRVEQSEVKLSEILEEQGLKFTPSGALLTRTGSLITFQEAQEKGYFKEISVSLDKIFEFFKERDRQRERFEQVAIPDSAGYSEGSTIESKMSSEDVKYLKQYVGKPLTLALAEITAKQPRDPIHYLGHYLFKYRYNQELEEVQKQEIDELTRERKLLAEERWKKFVEEEARNAVLDMILRAEQIAYENELKRIEQEQMLAEEEEEGAENQYASDLIEEARDKFE
ncbi:hypothetical protein MTP99_001795 [Tenebrio molitor]|uniref:trichohyalin-like n=1 Tax=Tenebrio molitor TaxID=7067 RepID=UPI002707AB4C|nr:hypothetical protein MTP99_001795 [Tenebrio molitor]